MKALGRLVMGQAYDCDGEIVNNKDTIKGCMEHGTKIGDAGIVENVFDLFHPHGVRGVALTPESHLAIHTWPEYSHAAIDFTYDEVAGPWKAYAYPEEKLGLGHVSAKEMKRGQGDFSGKKSPTNLLGTKEFGRWSK